jgi:NADPH2:quinone reductase
VTRPFDTGRDPPPPLRLYPEILREAKRLVEAGKITPLLDPRRFSFETVSAAYAEVENRTASGKIVIDVAE